MKKWRGGLWERYREAFSEAWAARDKERATGRRRREADFLPAVLEVQESPPHPVAGLLVWLIIGFFTAAVLWMVFGRMDIVATAQGRIVADSRTKIVQAADGGVVREIRVREGDFVKAGQVLFVLDSDGAQANVRQVRDSLLALLLEAEMSGLLAAAADGENPSAPKLDLLPSLAGVSAERLARQQRVLDGAYREHYDKLSQLRREMEVLESEQRAEKQAAEDAMAMLAHSEESNNRQQEGEREQIRKMEKLLPIVREQYETAKRLAKGGAIPRANVREPEEKHISLLGDLSYRRKQLEVVKAEGARRAAELRQSERRHRERLEGARAKMRALTQRLKVARGEFRRHHLGAQDRAEREKAQQEQELVKAEKARELREILSPADGVAEQLALHTEGGVVSPAQALLAIVPQEPVLEVEALVANKDIGFVREGQEAEVKIDAFPYTKYGLVPGEVLRLSTDAVEDENLGLVYRARILLKSPTIIADGREARLSPGMSVVAEIKTGERRIIEFFLSPLLKHGKESLKER